MNLLKPRAGKKRLAKTATRRQAYGLLKQKGTQPKAALARSAPAVPVLARDAKPVLVRDKDGKMKFQRNSASDLFWKHLPAALKIDD